MIHTEKNTIWSICHILLLSFKDLSKVLSAFCGLFGSSYSVTSGHNANLKYSLTYLITSCNRVYSHPNKLQRSKYSESNLTL